MHTGWIFPAPWRVPWLIAIHALQFLVAAIVFYLWLTIPEASVWQVLLSIVVGIAGIGALALLHGGTLRYFAIPAGETWSAAVRGTIPVFFPLLLWSFAATALAYFLAPLAFSIEGWSLPVASWLTMRLNRPVAPASLTPWLEGIAFLALLLGFVTVILPWGSAVALAGWRGFTPGAAVRAVTFGWRYLLLAGICCFVIYLGWLLVAAWIPKVEGLTMQAISFALRLGAGLSLTAAAWVALLELVARKTSQRRQFRSCAPVRSTFFPTYP